MSKLKYMTSDIDELKAAEDDLEANGIPRSHIHILSENENELRKRDLPIYSDWSKRDITYYGLRGALVGLILSGLIIGAALFYGVNDSVGWAIVGFVAAASMGFCTWEGGLMGVQRLNHEFDRYREALHQGEHLLVVDVDSKEEEYRTRYSVEAHQILRPVE